jgi:hypothetical protein
MSRGGPGRLRGAPASLRCGGTRAFRRSTMAILGLGPALPFRAFPPEPCSEAPRSQVVVPGGRVSRTSRGYGYEPRPRDAIPCSAFRIVSGDAPHEQGWTTHTTGTVRSQQTYSYRSNNFVRQFTPTLPVTPPENRSLTTATANRNVADAGWCMCRVAGERPRSPI